MPLPQELIDLVIDHLHDDFPALRSCSLVASSWRASSQLHLHAKVTLQPKPSETHARSPNSSSNNGGQGFSTRINSLLNTSPHLIPYIRTLVIREGDSPWLQREESLLHFLDALATSTRLLQVEVNNVDWRIISQVLQQGLLRVLSSRTLTEVWLVDCYLPSYVPWTSFVGPETKCLKLERVKVYSSGAEARSKVAAGDRTLTRLEISAYGLSASRLVPWILGTGSPHHTQYLKTLSLSCDRMSFEALDRLIKACPSLEYLKFEPWLFRWDHRDAFPFPSIANSPSLHTLNLFGLFTDQFRWVTAAFQRLIDIPTEEHLAASRPTPSLRTVYIGMTAQIPVLVSNDEALHKKIRDLDDAIGQLGDVKGYLKLSFPGMGNADGPCFDGEENRDELKRMTVKMKDLEEGLSALRVDVVG